MQTTPNTNLTVDDYKNLLAILDGVEVKGRKSAEYIAILALKLELRIQNWFDKHPTGFDIIEVAKTSEAYQAGIKQAVDMALTARDAAILPCVVPDQYSPEPNRNLESLG